jgi:cyclopropane fatty-acyl-phospholipid synthase-like methyltransferase
VNHIFNEEYYATSCGLHYSEFQKDFDRIAEHIVQDFRPKTVLDAGCAWGYLVASLRDRDVEAYGIDISEYAISQTRSDIRPFCVVGSLTSPLPKIFPQKFDLVANIEILEHLHEEDSLKVLSLLCKYSDKILFSSSPDDFTEATHYNVQQIEYWSKNFAKYGFFRSLDYRPDYISPQAILFEKIENSVSNLVENYERKLRVSNTMLQKAELNYISSIQEKDALIGKISEDSTAKIIDKDRQITMLLEQEQLHVAEIHNLTDQCIELSDTAEAQKHELLEYANLMQYLKTELENLHQAYNTVLASRSWKITKPIRGISKFVQNFGIFIKMRGRKTI